MGGVERDLQLLERRHGARREPVAAHLVAPVRRPSRTRPPRAAAGGADGGRRARRPAADHRDVEALVHAPRDSIGYRLLGVLLVMVDDFGHDEAQELLREHRIETRLDGQRPQPRHLLLLAHRVGGRQPDRGLVAADLLGDLEPLGEQVDERGVDVVDARPVTRQLVVGEVLSGRVRSSAMVPATLPCDT